MKWGVEVKFLYILLYILLASSSSAAVGGDAADLGHKQYKSNLTESSEVVPIGKKMDNMNVGTCGYLDYYIYYCKPFKCTLKMPIPGYPKVDFVVEGKKGNQCRLSYEFHTVRMSGEPYPIKLQCNLVESGLEAFRYQWKYYKDGYVDMFTKHSDNKLLRKQCVVR